MPIPLCPRHSPPPLHPSTLSSRRLPCTRLSSHHKKNDQVSPLPQLLRLPDDLLLQILEGVDQPKLKSMRLICRKLTCAATTALFSHLHLKSNMGSFCRLHTICVYPELSNMVKILSYSGKMLSTMDFARLGNLTVAKWYNSKIGVGFRNCGKADVQNLKAFLTADQRRYDYQKFCEHFHSQKLSRSLGIEIDYLFTAFQNLPNLRSICFDSGKANGGRSYRPDSLTRLSQIGREALVEPNVEGGEEYHQQQLSALLGAASMARKHLKVIELWGLRWEAQSQSHASLIRMKDAAKHCHRISIATIDCRDNSNERAVIAGMIAVASLLITLEISFGSPSTVYGYYLYVIDLESIIHANCASHPVDSWSHWPHLRRLKLEAMHTFEVCLRTFLAAHPSTLRSLELAHMYN